MSLVGEGVKWLDDVESYRGPDGVIHLAASHLEVTAISMVLAAAVSLPIGIALGHFRRGGPLVTLLANATRAVPTLGLLYLLAEFPTFGVSRKTAIIALTVFAIPPMLTNAWAGVSAVEPEAVDAARGLGMSQWSILRNVELPLSVPLIFAGVRSSTLQTFATATIASFVGTDTLGKLIQLGQAAGKVGQGEVLGAAVVIGVLAIVIDILLALIQRRLTPAPLRSRVITIRRQRAHIPGVGAQVG
ncbi:MAG TPA: ABC transporter permease [Frankiaceae bacterium]|jgi:osmoprotectant transport system permease protein|nr:ABC transporter permease [Frankiaceae bacterium]